MEPIAYENASADVRAVFDDIKRTRKVADVNNFWKFLAHDPRMLRHVWESLKDIAHRRCISLSDLIGEIDAKPREGNLASALRLYVLRFYRSQLPDDADREGVR